MPGSTSQRAVALSSSERFVSAQALISAFYAVLLFLAVENVYAWDTHLQATPLALRWPVFWLRFVDLRSGILAILWLHLIGTLLAVTLSRYRWARILVLISLLEFLGFRYSFGSINHGDHLGVLITFVLIFLPAGWRDVPPQPRAVRTATLLVFSGCQALILLTYSMAGMWKLGGIVRQLFKGEVHALWPQGLGQQIAAKLLADESTTVLGPWLIEHYWLGWPLMIATLYLQFFALWAAFRPSLHQTFGLGLMLFHLSSHLTMGIGFSQNTLWLALFLVFSPFRPRRFAWRQAALDLPILGRWMPFEREP